MKILQQAHEHDFTEQENGLIENQMINRALAGYSVENTHNPKLTKRFKGDFSRGIQSFWAWIAKAYS